MITSYYLQSFNKKNPGNVKRRQLQTINLYEKILIHSLKKITRVDKTVTSAFMNQSVIAVCYLYINFILLSVCFSSLILKY